MADKKPRTALTYSLLSSETIEKLRKQLPKGPLTEAFDRVMEERNNKIKKKELEITTEMKE